MLFSDLALAKRLELSEGHACAQFAEAQRRLSPESGAEWIECAGAYAAFNGIDSPVTQSFGLGLSEELSPAALDRIEQFFFERGTAAVHELSPFAGVAALELLCRRGYVPVELSSVLWRQIEDGPDQAREGIRARLIAPDEHQLWSEINARGWAGEYPEMLELIRGMGRAVASAGSSLCFLGEIAGEPAAAGALSIHDGVALLAGSATVPQFRRRGLHSALLDARVSYALTRGCDAAMIVAAPGSDSQRNAERRGFRIAYTRTKWRRAL